MSFGNPQIISSSASQLAPEPVPSPVPVPPPFRAASQFMAVTKQSPANVLHPDFAGGADPTGKQLSDAAIFAAIAYATQQLSSIYISSSVFLPAGTYLVSVPIVTPAIYGFTMYGEGKALTIIVQSNLAAAVLNIGGTGANPMHSNNFHDFQLTYSAPTANAGAICMLFSAMMYESTMEGIWFDNGLYGIQIAAGIACFWGSHLDDFVFGSGLSGGAIDGSLQAAAGIPNNHFGRFFVIANNMVGPIFNLLRGYNWVWDTCEIITANQGPQLLTLQAPSTLTMGALKLENGIYGAAFNAKRLIDVSGSWVEFGQLSFLGDSGNLSFNDAGGKMYCVNNGAQYNGNTPGKVKIGTLATGFNIIAGSVFVFGSGGSLATASLELDSWYQDASGGTQLTDNVSSALLDAVKVKDWLNDHMGQDNGDASLVITTGIANIQTWNTAFTANRTVTLPNVQGKLFNGLYYEFILDGIGAVGSFAVICNAVTLLTLPAATADKTILRFTFRRSAVNVQSGWKLTRYETGLPI